MNLMASFAETRNHVWQVQTCTLGALNHIAVNQFEGVVANNRTGRVRFGLSVLGTRVGFDLILQTR